jgi:amidase
VQTAEYARLDATALAALLRAGEVSAGEVLAAAGDAHARTHPSINAVVEWYGDVRPAATAGAVWPGVPLLRKDYGATEAGRLIERGSRLSAGCRAGATSEVMARIGASGLRVVGRAAVPEFILHATTESALHGVTRNPWNPERSAGGSSGGSAAAVAAGVVPLAHGSDCAGSIRIPAAVCGLIGLKPTRGRVPWTDGGTAGGWGGIAEEFVLTRTVRDAVTALGLLAGAAPRPADRPAPWRIGLVTDHWAGHRADPTLVTALEDAAQRIEHLGHAVVPLAWPLAYERIAALMDPIFGAGAVADIRAVAADVGRPLDERFLEPITLSYLDVVAALPTGSAERAATERDALTVELDRWWSTFDVIMCSTLGRASLPLGRLGGEAAWADWVAANDEFTPHSYVANLTGWPALSLPWGAGPDGVPIGIQLLAPRGTDEALLQLAADLEPRRPALGRPATWPS